MVKTKTVLCNLIQEIAKPLSLSITLTRLKENVKNLLGVDVEELFHLKPLRNALNARAMTDN